MKRTAFIFAAVSVIAIALCSCSKRDPLPQLSPATAAKAPQIPAGPEAGPYVWIGHLQHRDRLVTIKTGEQGTVYSVHDKDGKTLFENLTAEQLKKESPEIHGFIEDATVNGFAGMSLDRPAPGAQMLLMQR
jgi:hypothetical protein